MNLAPAIRRTGSEVEALQRLVPSHRADSVRRWRVVALAITLAVLGVVPAVLGNAASLQVNKFAPGRLSASAEDSVVVFPVQRFVKYGSSSTWSYFYTEFNADTVRGQRYLLEIVNGPPRVTNAVVAVNGREFVGSSECGTTVASLMREVDVAAGTMALTIGLKGSSGSWIELRVVRVDDPTFQVYPTGTDSAYRAFVRPTQIGTQTDAFSLGAAAEAPYTLRILNGSPSGSDRVTSGTVHISGSEVVNTYSFGLGIATITRTPALVAADTLSIYNSSAAGTRLFVRMTATDSTPPLVAITALAADTFLTAGAGVRVTAEVADETWGLASLNGQPARWAPGTISDSVSFGADGQYRMRVEVTNSARLTGSDSVLVIRDTTPPTLADSITLATTPDSVLRIAGSWVDSTHTTVSIDGEPVASGLRGGFETNYDLDVGVNRILFRAVDALGHVTEFQRFVFRGDPNENAPDSTLAAARAPEYSELLPTSFKDAVRFLYEEGQPPLQRDVDDDSVQAGLASVIRGQVLGRDWGPLRNVEVSVLGHPGLGHALTREDGRFDLVVNGGGPSVLRFRKPGWLEAQRTVTPPANDYAVLDSVALVGRTGRRTVADLDAGIAARGRLAHDADGDRDIRLFFEPGTRARVPVPGAPGQFVELAAARVRATEFTVGRDGAAAMPALLPDGSAFT